MATTPHPKRFRFPTPKNTKKDGTYYPSYFESLAKAVIKKGHSLLDSVGMAHIQRHPAILHPGDIVLSGSVNAPETWAMHNGSLTLMVPGQSYDLDIVYEVGSSRLDSLETVRKTSIEQVRVNAEFVGFAPDFAGGETKFVAAEGAA